MREQFLKIRGSSIFVKTMGSGTPLVFLHGGPGGEHRFFLPHVEELANFYQLIFYDQRGCGQSERLQDDSEYTIQEEIEALEELRIHLDIEKLNIVGESWGSILALCYATTYSENVNKIILTAAVGTTGAGLSEFSKELDRRLTDSDRELLETAIKRLKSGEGSVGEIFTVLDPYYVYNPEALTRKTKTESNEVVNRILGAQVSSSYDIRETLQKLVNIPILVLQGEHDLITPTKLEELLLQYIPNKTLVVLENCGHWTVVEQPERFNREVRKFLD